MKKVLIVVFLGMFILSMGLVQAQTESTLGTFKQGSTIQLTQTCDTCTFVNISSINFPDGTVLNINEPMTKIFQSYNYSFSSTSQMGKYMYSVCGDKDGNIDCENILFEINPTGNEFDNLWMNFLLLFALAVGGFVMIFAFADHQNTVFYYLGSFLLFSIGAYSVIFGFAGYQNLLTQAFGYIIWGSGALFLFRPWFEGTKWQW